MKLLDVHQLSDKLNVPVNTLYQWTSQKKIPYIKLRGQLRFDEDEVDGWITAMKVPAMST